MTYYWDFQYPPDKFGVGHINVMLMMNWRGEFSTLNWELFELSWILQSSCMHPTTKAMKRSQQVLHAKKLGKVPNFKQIVRHPASSLTCFLTSFSELTHSERGFLGCIATLLKPNAVTHYQSLIFNPVSLHPTYPSIYKTNGDDFVPLKLSKRVQLKPKKWWIWRIWPCNQQRYRSFKIMDRKQIYW